MSFLEGNKLELESFFRFSLLSSKRIFFLIIISVVAVTGEMQAAKSGGGGRPCPICAMYAYCFRPLADEWRVCGELVH